MKTLIILIVAFFATHTNASPGGAHGGIVLSGPSGIVTNQGAIGPAALGLGGLGAYGGYNGAYAGGPTSFVGGPAGPSAFLGGPAGPSAFLGGPAGPSAFLGGPVGSSAFLGSPALSHASVLGPAAGFGGPGLGLGLGGLGGLRGFGAFGGYSGYGSGIGIAPGVAVTNGGGTVGIGQHGVMVKGPATVPATIAGPAGKVVANGLYGVPSHGHGW